MMKKNWGFSRLTRWVWERYKWGRQWTITKVQGKNWKFLKSIQKAQNTRFSRLYHVAYKSPRQVARHLRQNFWKIFLSIFRDWKFHPQGSREGSCKNFWVSSRLKLPLVNKPLNWVARKLKTQNFWKFSKSFSRRIFDPPVSREKLLCRLTTEGMRLVCPATKSPEQGNTVFEIFDIFVKTKDFPKIIKTLKNIFVFDQQKLSMWNTFKQVQSHKWIRHSLSINMYDMCGYQNWDSPWFNVKFQ